MHRISEYTLKKVGAYPLFLMNVNGRMPWQSVGMCDLGKPIKGGKALLYSFFAMPFIANFLL